MAEATDVTPEEEPAAPRPSDHLTGLQKAAVLVVLLGEEATAPLVPHLSQREVARLAQEVAALGQIDREVARDVLEQYYAKALEGPPDAGGPEVARKILAQAHIDESLVDRLVRGNEKNENDSTLGPLLEAPTEVLARVLREEHPQTMALVLLYLPAKRAAELLSALPEEARSETVLRMATLRQVRGEMLGEVAASLKERVSNLRGQDTGDGMDRTVEVLTKMARAEIKRVLETMEEDHPEQVAAMRERIFTFESLLHADDRGMQELLRAIDSSKLGVALVGADAALQDRFLGNLSTRAASMLREEMEFLGTPKESEQQEARKAILDQALELETQGSLVFETPDDD